MPRVNHIYVVKIGGCRLVSEVYHMVKRQVPNREGFVFSIANLVTSEMLKIKLRKAGGAK